MVEQGDGGSVGLLSMFCVLDTNKQRLSSKEREGVEKGKTKLVDLSVLRKIRENLKLLDLETVMRS